VVAEVVARFGPVGILVNNAGVSLPAPIDGDGYDAAWDVTVAVNLTGYVRMVRACLPHLLAAGAGRIVNVASTEGLGATPYISPYTAAKHGVVGLTRSLATELGSRGITVNCVCPGPINTGMTAPIPDDAKQKFARRRVPLRRYGEPEEVAQMILSAARIVVRERRDHPGRRRPHRQVRLAALPDEAELWDLYSEAVIDCDVDGSTRSLRGPQADPLPAAAPVFVVTAHNPDGVAHDEPANSAAERALERDLAAGGVRFWPATGRSRDASWREPGVAVVGFDREQACAIGLRYGQLAVFELTAEHVHVVRCADAAVVRTRERDR
jgi:Enoyl-(Acyl carrier protein) reductase/Protein of unknown function (DUF3293)